jgi:RNA polymerase sigma factor (TIGR02999 family)
MLTMEMVQRPTTSEYFSIVYDELRRVASAELARLRPGQTLQPTALVNEAYMKLAGPDDASWAGSAHFFGAAAQAMREIVVDHLRRRNALKRGGGRAPEPLFESGCDLTCPAMPIDDVLAVDAAIRELEREHPRKATVVVMRYFAGMSMDQIAAALDVTTRTVEREWRVARALLADALGAGGAA